MQKLLLSAVAVVALVAAVPRPSVAAGENTLLILVDRSSSMAEDQKWTDASLAIVQALDDDAVDAMSIGLIASPVGSVTGPACVLNFPVPCLAPTLPQIAITPAGTQKSTAASGVRRNIADWLEVSPPTSGPPDGFPLYESAVAALAHLSAAPGPGPRTLLILTDGGISCGSVANPARPGFTDCNGCTNEWESPNNLVALVTAARNDPVTPIQSFVIGLPGSDTTIATGCGAPPYSMKLALSSISFAGSPESSVPGCTGTTFSQLGGDPSMSCHQDLSSGFSAASLTAAISSVVLAIVESPPVPSLDYLGIALLGLLVGAAGLRALRS